MPRNPTLSDLAQAAGVSLATIDRALHARGKVSARSILRIQEAATRIGFRDARFIPVPTLRPAVRLGFVLHKGAQEFYRNLSRALEDACQSRTDVTITPEFRYAASQAPDDFCAELAALGQTCNAVATSAVTHAKVARFGAQLGQQGLPVFALLNDFGRGAHQGYFGLDNLRVGRIAGWMMAQRLQRGGRAAVFVGGNRWHGHALRETGFRSALREYAPSVTVLDTLVNLETRQVTYEATLNLLDTHSDLRGIYVAGGGMEGAIAALREMRPPEKVALVLNELTAESRAALQDRYALMAIATPITVLADALVGAMLDATQATEAAQDRTTIFDPAIWLPESC
ncbi:LacI family DNA-binding transcriptional regulator [Roseinatronobacter sp.]|uniref:LacI family DNA-binding transcriptional regulator n=1 Tax=Roseinatronobacter sp. TaxID=1945755 RepID=UPI003F712749